MESQVLQYMLGMLVVAVLNKHDIALAVWLNHCMIITNICFLEIFVCIPPLLLL
jgi:hypothetical protein